MNYSDYFVVDPESPTGLRWRDDLEKTTGTRRRNAQAGKPAGVRRKIKGRTDQIVVTLEGKIYITSRVIWEMVFGVIPEGMIVDHKDGDGFNNKISNLELKTKHENMMNRKVNRNNTTGLPGITFEYNKGYPICVASYQDQNKKTVSRAFSIRKYGLLPATKMAVVFRVEGLRKLNELYAFKYTDRHVTGGL